MAPKWLDLQNAYNSTGGGAVSQKECKKNLIRYSNPKIKYMTSRTWKPPITGLKGTKKNYIFLAHESDMFEKNPKKAWFDAAETEVPKGWTPFKPQESALKSMCTAPRPRLKNAHDLSDWISLPAVKAKGLTIADVASLKPGDRLSVVTIDRNVGDAVGALKPNRVYSAAKALADSRATYVHRGGMGGVLTLYAESGDPVVLDPFEFHVEYAPGRWYPLEAGVLPAKDPQGQTPLLGKKTRWQDMPRTTRVGYRGSMLPQTALAALPPFYVYYAWP